MSNGHPVELSPERAAKIKQEEEKRAQFRREILQREATEEAAKKKAEQKDKTKGQKLVDFLNTQLGLWLLGTVLLGTLAQAWSIFQANERERDQLRRMYGEVSFRASSADNYYRPEDFPGAKLGEGPDAQSALGHLRYHRRGNATNLYAFPEFEKWETDTLLVELALLGGTGEEKAAKNIQTNLDTAVAALKTETNLNLSGFQNSMSNIVALCDKNAPKRYSVWVLLALAVVLLILLPCLMLRSRA